MGFPVVKGTVPFGATHEMTSERIGRACVESNDATILLKIQPTKSKCFLHLKERKIVKNVSLQ
jgi:hypothetical protein